MQEKWKRGQEWNDMRKVIIESEVNRWIEPTASQSQMNEGPYSWAPGLWADIYPLFFWPPIVQIVPCAGLSTRAVFSDTAKPGGVATVCCVWRLDYAEWQTGRGIWRRFSREITAGPLRVVCLPFSSRASLSELLPCWLATLKTPPPLDWLSSLWGAGEDKEGNGWRDYWEEATDRRRKREKYTQERERLGRDRGRWKHFSEMHPL